MGVLDAPGLTRQQADARYSAYGEKNVAIRGRLGSNLSNGTDTSQTSRFRMVLAGNVTIVRLVYANFYQGSGLTEPSGNTDVTVKASIENPALPAGDPTGAATIPVFFRGQRTAVMPVNSILISDPIYVNIADGAPLWVRSNATVTAGGKWVNSYATAGTAGASVDGGGVLEGAIANTDAVDSGAIASSSTNAFGPCAVLGNAATRKPSVLVVGDSIAFDTGVVTAGALGYIARACVNAGYPTLRIAEGGERVLTVIQQMNYWKRMRLAQYATHAICNYGTNDIYGSNRTLTQLKADSLTLWGILARTGLKVYQTTILPRPNASTDGYMTVAGQSIANATQEGYRAGFNSWLRDTSAAGAVAQSGGTLLGIYDPCATIEVNSAGTATLNGGFWKTAPGGIVRTGTATAATASVITDTGAARTTNADIGLVLAIISATTGAAQSNEVASNTATAWNLSGALGIAPTGTVTYQLGHSYCIDGTHPSEEAHVLMGNAMSVANMTV